ncbi:partial Putative teichuronic acid biosynthesis glycosyltransferase TuaC, partial [uncultured bacterium]
MTITVLSTAFPLRGGIAHYVSLLVAALRKRHDVQVLTFKRQYPAFLFPGKTQEETGSEGHDAPAPQVMDSINPFNWISVGLRLRRERPDLIIFKYWLPFFGPCFGTIAALARSNGHTRVLIVCDNVIPHERRPGDILFTRYLLRFSDHFIVQSASVERDLLSLKPGASYRFAAHPVYDIFGTVMPATEARAALGITAPRVLLFFGYIRKYKGLHVLLDAIHRLPASFNLQTFVVGEFYDDEAKYRDQVARLGLGDRVTIVSDYVPNDKVRQYFSAADAVVLPYLSATQSGIAQIAYNFDLPVIATDVGGLAEVVRHEVTGLITAPNDPDALATTIRRYYEDGLAERYRPHV